MDSNEKPEIDWLALSTRINEWQQQHRGWLAELKRCPGLDDIADYPAYYRLIQGYIKPDLAAQRIAFLMPWLVHRQGAMAIGESFKIARISETRLFQMLRSESPKDIEMLRRLVRHAAPAVDWTKFGPIIQYWGKWNKRQIVEQYFLGDASSNSSNPPSGQADESKNKAAAQ
ncbi:MAG: hypothetical protein KUG79_16935 [Pseudomonadales bacterium]|nr:hypothetical protein [Pseudomonadales bacterium]